MNFFYFILWIRWLPRFFCPRITQRGTPYSRTSLRGRRIIYLHELACGACGAATVHELNELGGRCHSCNPCNILVRVWNADVKLVYCSGNVCFIMFFWHPRYKRGRGIDLLNFTTLQFFIFNFSLFISACKARGHCFAFILGVSG